MSTEKPVELTEAEKDVLDAAYDSDFLGLVEVIESIVTAREIAAEQRGREDNALHDMCYVSGSKALEAREAAARREALQEAAEKHRVEVERLTDAFTEAAHVGHDNAKAYLAERRRIARVEALAGAAEATAVGPPFVFTRDLRAALADPERDEESGR